MEKGKVGISMDISKLIVTDRSNQATYILALQNISEKALPAITRWRIRNRQWATGGDNDALKEV